MIYNVLPHAPSVVWSLKPHNYKWCTAMSLTERLWHHLGVTLTFELRTKVTGLMKTLLVQLIYMKIDSKSSNKCMTATQRISKPSTSQSQLWSIPSLEFWTCFVCHIIPRCFTTLQSLTQILEGNNVRAKSQPEWTVGQCEFHEHLWEGGT